MATRRKKAAARVKLLRPAQKTCPRRADSAAANDEGFIFKFSFEPVPGEPVGCVIRVVAPNPGAALARARDVLHSMQMGVWVTDQVMWPDDIDVNDDAMYMKHAHVYLGPSSTLTLNHVTMISRLGGPNVDVDPGELKPTTNVRKLINRWLSGTRRRT